MSMISDALRRRLGAGVGERRDARPQRAHRRDAVISALWIGGVGALIVFLLQRLGVPAALLDAGFDRFAVFFRWPAAAEPWSVYLTALVDTLAMALAGTVAAAVLVWPLALVAARIACLRGVLLRTFDLFRSVDVMVWALLCVGIVGPGAFAGALAIAASEIGILGRLFTEAADRVPRDTLDGVRSVGADGIGLVRYAVIPQAVPDWITCFLFQIEGNIRSAAVLGIAGAGGIGFYLTESVRLNRFDETSAVLLPVAAAVFAVDRFSAVLRQRIQTTSTTAHF